MECTARITPDLLWVGGNDRRLNLFENIFPIPRGVSYNSYLLLDEKTVLVDTVDKAISRRVLRQPDRRAGRPALNYIVVNHMEPTTPPPMAEVCGRYPGAQVMLTAKGAQMAAQFFGDGLRDRLHAVSDGAELVTGRHHPALFHGAHGSLARGDGHLGRNRPGALLRGRLRRLRSGKRLPLCRRGGLCPRLAGRRAPLLHQHRRQIRRARAGAAQKGRRPGHRLPLPAARAGRRRDIAWFVEKYQRWSTYRPEEDGVLVAYASIYGHTENAAEVFAMALRDAGVKHVAMYDVSVTHPSYILSDAFRFGKLALLSATYNLGVFPAMETLLLDLKAHALQDRTVALVENGSWAPAAGKQMREILGSMKNIRVLEPVPTIRSALAADTRKAITDLARQLAEA